MLSERTMQQMLKARLDDGAIALSTSRFWLHDSIIDKADEGGFLRRGKSSRAVDGRSEVDDRTRQANLSSTHDLAATLTVIQTLCMSITQRQVCIG